MRDVPALSVIVPAYNRARTLEACLSAVRASTFLDYELIVVDCGSLDATCAIARRYADHVIELRGIPSSSAARNRGVASARGEVIVNVDSDVVIKPDALSRIADYLSGHPDIEAVTGLLAKHHPHADFFSQYKNLYMHDTFRQLPERVRFLYGSIHAVRRHAARPYVCVARVADDLILGQQLAAEGKCLAFLRDLEVVHLKRYHAWSLLKNDFRIPFAWAVVFLAYHGWRQLGRNGTGFAHAQTGQLVSVILVPVLTLGSVLAILSPWWLLWAGSLLICWLFLNRRFVVFLAEEQGVGFGLLGCAFTLLDQLVMATGILCGFVYAVFKALCDGHTTWGRVSSPDPAILYDAR